jgi:anti-sigma regulatory factor (Ser/Thr protein kinase)
MPTVRLAFTPAAAHVRTARLVAVAVARRAGVSAELFDEIRLAIGEACSRAVALHRQHGLTDLVEVALSDTAGFTIRVTDRAPIDAGLGPAAGGADPVALMEEAALGGGLDGSGPGRSGSGQAGAGSGSFPGEGAFDDPTDGISGGEESGRPEQSADEAEEAVAVGMRLALLASLVDQITVRPAEHGAGTEVVMSWPTQSRANGGRP